MKTIEERNHITEGPLLRSIVLYFIPIFLGSLLQQSYNVIDAVIIGRFVGPNGLAAIDATYNYTRLLLNVFLAVALGGSILVSQYKGARNIEKIKKAVSTILIFGALGGLIVSIIGIVLAPFFAKLMNVPEDILVMCVSYLRIYFIGAVFSLLFNLCSGILKAFGDTKRPFFYLLLSSVINILLDIYLVAILKLGVSGAAAATVIAQLIASLLILNHLRNRKDSIRLEIKKMVLDNQILKEILRLGIPLGAQSALYAISNMVMQRGINTFGVIGIAAWSLCGKMDFIIWLTIDALAMTITTFVAQNYGALKEKRMKHVMVLSTVLSFIVITFLSSMLFFFTPTLTAVFTDDKEVILMTTRMMKTIAPFYIMASLSQIIASSFKGIGETFKPMIVTLISACGVKILWVMFILPINGSALKAIAGYPFSWGINMVLMMVIGIVYKKEFSIKKNRMVS